MLAPHIDAAPGLDGARGERGHGVVIRHVGGHGQGPAGTQRQALAGRLLQLGRLPGREDQADHFTREGMGRRTADAARCPGDHHDPWVGRALMPHANALEGMHLHEAEQDACDP